MPKVISKLFVYPIKSCRGIALEGVEITPNGPKYDREFVLVDDNGKFLSQRREPRMCLIETAFRAGNLIVSHSAGLSMLGIPLVNEKEGQSVAVDIFGKIGYGIDQGDFVAEWFSNFLGLSCRLLRYDRKNPRYRPSRRPGASEIPLKFHDGFPVLMISEASFADLNVQLIKAITIDRFRPNIVVAAGNTAFEEDDWIRVSAGTALFIGEKQCERCIIPTIDPLTGIRDETGEPITTLKTYRRAFGDPEMKGAPVVFGKNLSVLRSGGVSVGDVIIPTSK